MPATNTAQSDGIHFSLNLLYYVMYLTSSYQLRRRLIAPLSCSFLLLLILSLILLPLLPTRSARRTPTPCFMSENHCIIIIPCLIHKKISKANFLSDSKGEGEELIPIVRGSMNSLIEVRFGFAFVSLCFPYELPVQRKQFAISRVRKDRSSVIFLCSHRIFLHLHAEIVRS